MPISILKMRARIAISFFGNALLFETQRRIVCDGVRSRHHVHEVQRSSAHSRREDRDLFELVHQIATNHDLDSKRQLRHVATRKRSHEAIERSFAAPAIVIFARHAIQTESDVRNGSAICLKRGPDAIEVPAVGNKADSQTGFADRLVVFPQTADEELARRR